MTPLPTLLAEARRIAEEVQASEAACMAAIKGNHPGLATAMKEYRDKADDLAPRLAAALLALIPVVEATEAHVNKWSHTAKVDDLIAALATLTEALK